MKREIPGFFSAPVHSQTYLNILYLLISFPLGLIYFIFITTGLSLGFGLFITWFGIPILLGVMFVWLGFAYFERQLAGAMLGIEVSYVPEKISKEKSLWKKLKKRFIDSSTWKSLAYLAIKFPLGILSFTILIFFISLSLGLISTPLVYYLSDIGIIPGDLCIEGNWCFLSNYPVTILAGLIGILMIFVSLAIFNALAKVSGLLAKTLLEKNKTQTEIKKPAKRANKKSKIKKRKKK
ncbi:MAG: sensor domain-containing protein [archaeon]